jgi:tetratricopeptide (TPR) repeat protein
MTAASLSSLDQTELIQLALDANRNNNAGAALAYLKEAATRPDATAMAHFLLGSEYAQLRMYDRALSEMESAVALDPSMSLARFQLGLLLLTSGIAERATETLRPLCELGPDNAFAHFGQGLIHLTKDEFPEAIRSLKRGMELNSQNAPLNTDMQKIIDRVKEVAPDAEDKADKGAAAEADSQHILLSAYTSKTTH